MGVSGVSGVPDHEVYLGRGTFVINSTPDIVAVLFIDHPHGDDRDDDDNEDKDDDDDENNVYWGSELLPEQIEYYKSKKFHIFLTIFFKNVIRLYVRVYLSTNWMRYGLIF